MADLPYSDEVKAYLATPRWSRIRLWSTWSAAWRETGQADDTVIVIGGDHYPYGLGYGQDALAELHGHNADDAWQRDHNRMIIRSGCLEDESTYTDSIVDGP